MQQEERTKEQHISHAQGVHSQIKANEFCKWMKDKYPHVEGFSQSSISNLFSKNPERKIPKIKEFTQYAEEYLEELQSNVHTPAVWQPPKRHPKMEQLLNTSYNLYYFETRKSESANFIGKAILKFGADERHVEIDNIVDGLSTNYAGTMVAKGTEMKYVLLHLTTPKYHTKDLHIILRLHKENKTDYMIGGFLNISSDDAIVMGTVVAEINTDADPKPEILQPHTESYKNLKAHIKRFFREKGQNFIKTRSKGIFTNEDFASFFIEQDEKSVRRDRIEEGHIFISYPVTHNKKFEELNETIKEVAECLKKSFKVDVFFVGSIGDTKDDVQGQPSSTLQRVLEWLHGCDRYLLIYPDTIPSSCFIELGMALSARKHCTVLYRAGVPLPSIVQLNNNINKYVYDSNEDLIKQITKQGEELFKKHTYKI